MRMSRERMILGRMMDLCWGEIVVSMKGLSYLDNSILGLVCAGTSWKQGSSGV